MKMFIHTTIKNKKSINIFKCNKLCSTLFVFVILHNSEPAVPRITSYKAYSCKTDLNNETRWNLLLTTSLKLSDYMDHIAYWDAINNK